MKNLSRILVSLVAAMFAVAGIGFTFTPDTMANRFGFAVTGTSGLINLRADLGGLFLGLAVLCAIGAWTRRRAALNAAAVVVATVLAGRCMGWLVEGRVSVPELAIELIALAVLILASRASRETTAVSEPRRVRKPVRIAVAALAVLAVGVVAAAFNPAVQQELFDRAAMTMTARVNQAPLADDALRVAIAGSSAPLPSRDRAKASVVVFAAGKFWVVDAGPESVENLVLWGIPLSRIGGVLLTHFHSDHIGDLGELQLQTWAGGRPAQLQVYGGPGVDGVVAGFNEAYRLDQGYRTEHHGEKVMPSAAWGMTARTVTLDGPPTRALDRTGVVLEENGLRITAIEVNHAPIQPAYAYRFDYKGRSVVVTGDLKNHPPLVKSASNADILVSEAISRSMTKSLETAAHAVSRDRTEAIMHDVQDYHIAPEEAAAIANGANVKLLVFYHLLPAPDNFLTRRLFAQGVNEVRRGDWTIANDGSLYTLPLGSDRIVRSSVSN